MRAHWFLVTAWIPINIGLAAEVADKATDPPDCTTLAATPSNGTATDRFMREWCQRNAQPMTPITPIAPSLDAATQPQPVLPQPAAPTPAPRYSNDDSADQLNSSRLPPGYHCHMLKFGERICHGGLD